MFLQRRLHWFVQVITYDMLIQLTCYHFLCAFLNNFKIWNRPETWKCGSALTIFLKSLIRAAHFKLFGTVAISSDILVMSVINGNTSVQHSNNTFAGIGSNMHDFLTSFRVSTSKSSVVVGAKHSSLVSFDNKVVSMIWEQNRFADFVDKSFLMKSILLAKISAKLFASWSDEVHDGYIS